MPWQLGSKALNQPCLFPPHSQKPFPQDPGKGVLGPLDSGAGRVSLWPWPGRGESGAVFLVLMPAEQRQEVLTEG